ncbi:DUF6752 domain-containing protein [Blastococcus sp. SYSU D00820]
MTDPDNRTRSALARPVHVVRRALAPAALELHGEVNELQQENQQLRDRLELVENELTALRAARDELQGEVARLRDGLHQERRLHLRVAELTDLVTELVLPLHDREIDPAVLGRLRPDTL